MKNHLKILVIFALESETQNLFNDIPQNVIYTGVGKVNATYRLTKEIMQNRPNYIINLGTAGSKIFNYGEIVMCEKFVQRDMNTTAFGYENFITPNDSTPQILTHISDFSSKISPLFKNHGICGTGDSFETKITGEEIYNVVDMEGYALAKISQIEQIPFVSIKFISDGADGNAPNSWNESLAIGARKMHDAYKLVIDNIQQI